MDPHSAHAEIARKLGLYHTGLEEAGHPAVARDIPIGRLIAVAETDAKAEAIARRGANWTAGAYISKQAIAQFRADGREVDPADHYLADVVIHGSPEKVVDTLQRLAEEVPGCLDGEAGECC